MIPRQTIKAADLFCGAGGTSSGLIDACSKLGYSVELTAINHWDVAVATHKLNHPDSRHLCASLDNINPRDYYQEGELDLLWASPECTHHSVARGGKPINDQSRATAFCVLRWVEALRPRVVLVENVKEFRTWGPISTEGQPIKRKKGEVFLQWIRMLESFGYKVEYRVLCAADYGDPTTRERLFIYAVRGQRKIVWPNPTHIDPDQLKGTKELFTMTRKPWVPARAIIDWTDLGKSIFRRKRPLAPKTLERIYAGLHKYSGIPFIIPQHSGGAPRNVSRPVPTVTTTARGIGLAQPFLLPHPGHHSAPRSIDDPMNTITATSSDISLVRPHLVHLRGTGKAQSIDKPLGAVTAGNQRAIVNGCLLKVNHGDNGSDRTQSLDQPVKSMTCKNGVAMATPVILGIDHTGGNGNQVQSSDEPLSTVTTKQRHAVAVPFLTPVGGPKGKQRPKSIDRPMDSILCENHEGVVQPFLTKFYSTGKNVSSVEQPVPTITTNDRLGLVQPRVIFFRMLKPKELAAAQGFPADYQFSGNSEKIVKQIGNAVPPGLSRALVRAAVSQKP